MTQYMLAVHGTVDDPTEVDMEEMQPIFEAVDKVNQKMKDAGIWVFGGGLEAIDVATTVDSTGADPIITSRHTLSCSRRTLRWIPSTHM